MKSGNNQRFLEPFVEIPSSIDVDEIKSKIFKRYFKWFIQWNFYWNGIWEFRRRKSPNKWLSRFP